MSKALPKSKREPEVIVFQERSFRRPNRKHKSVNTNESVHQKAKNFINQKLILERDGLDFKKTMQEIRALTSSALEGREKVKNEEEYVKMLGGKGTKPVRMPYPHYMAHLKKQKEKQRKEAELLPIGQQDAIKDKSKKKIHGRSRWQDKPPVSLEPSIGKFKGGTLQLSVKDIKYLKSSRK